MQSPAGVGHTIALATIAEGHELLAESAIFCGACRRGGAEVKAFEIDACASEEGFRQALRSSGWSHFALPWTLEWHPFLQRVAALVAAEGLTPVVFGDGLARRPLAADGWPRGAALVADVSRGLNSQERPPRWSLDAFARGSLLAQPIRASMFGELGAAGLVLRMGQRSDLSPVAALARLEAPSAAPRPIVVADLHGAIDALGAGLRHVELWDRFLDPADLATVAELRQRWERLTFSARGHRLELRSELLASWREAGISRVNFDVDAVATGPRLPQTSWTVEELRSAAALVRAAGLEVGIVLVVGVPGESRQSAPERFAEVAALAPDALRVLPFEPAGGHPAHSELERQGALPLVKEPWIREVHHPLRTPELPVEDFHRVWESALVLLAREQLRLRGRRS